MPNEMNYDPVTGDHLREWGHPPGPRYKDLLDRANAMRAEGYGLVKIRQTLEPEIPPAPVVRDLRAPGEVPFHVNIEAAHPDEEANIAKVRETMTELMRVPTIEAGAIMPDACPAGPVGTIPVGGVAAAKNAIHPGMHSADICCSVMITDLGHADPRAVLDAAQSVTHFGPGGRPQGDVWGAPKDIAEAMRENPFSNGEKCSRMVDTHFGTQGDGNHFLFVGRSRATAKQNAWIPADTDEGRAYWDALQLLRAWTKANHIAIHDRAAAAAGAEAQDRFWNEHNFVFERDGLYYHGKGATPAWNGFAADATGLTLIPLNMSEPVLVVRGKDAKTGLGFSPHGAGRNFSRSEHKRRMGSMTPDQALKAETQGLDVRFHAGGVDASELPSSYKNADAVVAQIKSYGLAEIDDYIDPYGCIMAGDIPPFWQKKKRR